MVFAYDDNFSGMALYERDLCLLQKGTLDKLLAAQKKFKADGYSIKIYDAYRPQYVQKTLFKIVNNPIYIADPQKASDHVRGAAVDITLVDSRVNELEMPSTVHTFNFTAGIYNKAMTKAARKNMEYMQKIMLESGFLLYKGEWWHFKDIDFEQYNITNHHFNDIEMVTDKSMLK
jgi:D-alanyl-D-alanine dipeptidase